MVPSEKKLTLRNQARMVLFYQSPEEKPPGGTRTRFGASGAALAGSALAGSGAGAGASILGSGADSGVEAGVSCPPFWLGVVPLAGCLLYSPRAEISRG